MRSRVVVEFDTTEFNERKIVNKLGAALIQGWCYSGIRRCCHYGGRLGELYYIPCYTERWCNLIPI